MLPHEYRTMFAAEDQHWWYHALRFWLEKMLTRYVSPGARILDAGCGTGATLAFLRTRGYEAIGIELAAKALRLAAERPAVRGRLCGASVDLLPVASTSFDAAVCLDVLYLLSDEQEAITLAELRRVLKPGGILIVHLPAFEWLRGEHDQAVATQRRYTATSLRRLLTAAGFEVLRLEYRYWLFLPAVWVVRRLWRYGQREKAMATSDLTLSFGFANSLLTLAAEAEDWIGQWTPRPWGSSVCAVAITPPSVRVRCPAVHR